MSLLVMQLCRQRMHIFVSASLFYIFLSSYVIFVLHMITWINFVSGTLLDYFVSILHSFMTLYSVLQHERGIRRPDDSKKPPANTKPSKTLFVINFDPIHTRTRDLEKHFDLYGKIMNIRIRRNFAFIQYESQEDATKALDATNSRFYFP